MESLTVDGVEIGSELSNYRELMQKRQALLGRIERAESERHTVKERVFQRVCEEYEKELQHLENEIEPLAKDVEKARVSIENEIADIDSRTEVLEDEIEEVTFRCRVGEFDERMSKERQATLHGEYERFTRRRRELSEMLSRIDAADASHTPEPARDEHRAAGQTTDPPSPDISQEDPPPTLAKLPIDTAHAVPPAPGALERPSDGTFLRPFDDLVAVPKRRAADEENTAETEAFVDPTEWVGEFVEDETTPELQREDGTASSPVSDFEENDTSGSRLDAENAADALSELADPCDESAENKARPTRSIDASHDPSLDALPLLTIAKGPGMGKRLPLLPMTMTLGREVDNNIELKDGDVARYHARISFEAGRYVIQDLEGSPGTFVDGQRIAKTALSPGSVIRVGGTELKFDLG